MVSLRQISSCMGLYGEISILHNFFGFVQPLTLTSPSLSLLTQVRLLQGKHIHLNLIQVGGSDKFKEGDEEKIDRAAQKMRDIYAQVALGVGRIKHYYVPLEDAKGKDIIDNDDEAEALTNEWTVHNDGLDVFLVRSSWTGSGDLHVGMSATNGPCNKDDDKSMTGSVVSIGGGSLNIAITLAHEVGHYLGLPHINDLDIDDVREKGISYFPLEVSSNLMFPMVFSWKLTAEQGAIMKAHCFVRPGC